jgi:hypothetical protein
MKGSDYYKLSTSPARALAKYVRVFDIIRAMGNQQETLFGGPEWDHLSEGVLVQVWFLENSLLLSSTAN